MKILICLSLAFVLATSVTVISLTSLSERAPAPPTVSHIY
jgi:hypothetical protein